MKSNEISSSIALNKACSSISTQRPRKRRVRKTRSSKNLIEIWSIRTHDIWLAIMPPPWLRIFKFKANKLSPNTIDLIVSLNFFILPVDIWWTILHPKKKKKKKDFAFIQFNQGSHHVQMQGVFAHENDVFVWDFFQLKNASILEAYILLNS